MCPSEAPDCCFSNRRIQQPQSPDLELSIIHTQQRVLSRPTVDNANHNDCQVGVVIEREYLLVPFDPGYCFNKLKEENIRLHQRVKSLEQGNVCQCPRYTGEIQLNPTDKSDDRHQGSNCPLMMRILEKTFSKQAVKIAKDFLGFENDRYPVPMSTLLEQLYDIDDGKFPVGMAMEKPTQERNAGCSLKEEEAENSNLYLHLTLKLKNTVNGGQ